MKKLVFILCMSALFFMPVPSRAMEVGVDITGVQDPGPLKAGIEKTVVARCVSKGIQLEGYKKLSITISRLGDVLSYDALLDSVPPRAFHKDIKDTSTISGTIDEMIGAIFESAPKVQAPPPQAVITQPAPPQTLQKNPGLKAKLPFIANSIASVGEKVFISDSTKVYELKGDKATAIWQTPGKIEILRIYPYGDSLIVLGKINSEDLRTFRLKDGKVIKRWDKAVLPIGKGLVSSELVSDIDMSGSPYIWQSSKQADGSSPKVPEGLDMISAVVPDNVPPDSEIVSYDQNDKLTVYKGSEIIWKSDSDPGLVPEFVEDPRINPPTRYYLKPRILVIGGKIVSFKNEQGLAKMLSRVPVFNESKIDVYTTSGDNDFEKTTVATFPESYCSDITLLSGKLAALIVKEKKTYLQLLDL